MHYAQNYARSLLQFINVINSCLIDLLLHCSSNFVVNQVQTLAFRVKGLVNSTQMSVVPEG